MDSLPELRQLVFEVIKQTWLIDKVCPEIENREDGVRIKFVAGQEYLIPNDFLAANASRLDYLLGLPIKSCDLAVYDVLAKFPWVAELKELLRHADARPVSTTPSAPPLPPRRWLVLSDEESRRLERAYFGPDRKAAYAALQSPGELHWAVLNFDWRNADDCFSSVMMNPRLDWGTVQYWRFNARGVNHRVLGGKFDQTPSEWKFRSKQFQFVPFWEPGHDFSRDEYRPNRSISGNYDAVYRPRTSDSPNDTIQSMRLSIREALAIHPVPAFVIEDVAGMSFYPLGCYGTAPCESFEFRVDDRFLIDHQNNVARIMNAQIDRNSPDRVLKELHGLFWEHPAKEFLWLRDELWNRSDAPSKGYKLSPVERARLARCYSDGDQLAAYRALRTRFELHEAALNFNYDDPVEWLHPIIRNPQLDQGTALEIFWNRYLSDVLPEPGAVERTDVEYVALAKELYRNLLIGYYTTKEFSFEMEEGLTERPDIPDSLKQPIHGKYPGSSQQ